MKARGNLEAQEAIAEIEGASTISTIPSEQTTQEDDSAGFPFPFTWYYSMNKKLKRISKGLDEINKILDGIPHFTRPSSRTDTDDTGQDKMAP